MNIKDLNEKFNNFLQNWNNLNDLDEAKKHKLKRQSFINTLKEQDLKEKLISNRRFRKKKSEVDRLEEQKLNESYYDFSWATSAEEIDFYTDTDSYNLININNKCFAIFTDEYTGGERITERVSDWFDTKEEAMNYYYNNLTEEEDYDESFEIPSTRRFEKKLNRKLRKMGEK